MKANERILELHPHQSKLMDSLCFELAVNIPDDNSLSLLDVLAMRTNEQITNEECMQLYREWLQSKNIYDIFSAKQVKAYPKEQLVKPQLLQQHLLIDTINHYLELLNHLYNSFHQQKQPTTNQQHIVQHIEPLFSYLDEEGKIHLRLSQLFFLNIAFLIHQNTPIPTNYNQFKPYFKSKNRELCQINGIVSLRWFKNYFLMKKHQEEAQLITDILKDMERGIKSGSEKNKKGVTNGLPNVLQQAFVRWKESGRFAGVFQSKKKRLQIYMRVFEQNEQVFYFNGGKQEYSLSQNYFVKKYGEQLIRTLQIDTSLLKEFADIVRQVLNQYLALISKLIQTHSHHQRSSLVHSPPYYFGNNQHPALSPKHPLKKNPNKSYQAISKYSHNKSDINSNRQKTPTKNTSHHIRGNQTKRLTNVTPSNKKNNLSPLIHKQFASTEKYTSNKGNLTPTKSSGPYSLYMGNTQQIYKNSKKEGLEKDSFYEKLFFFRNKRVESFDIVIKRLKGK